MIGSMALLLAAALAPLGPQDKGPGVGPGEEPAATTVASPPAKKAVSRAKLMAIGRELARSLGQEVTLETRPLASGDGLAVALRVGPASAGHALVIGDFTSPTVDGLESRTREAALLARALFEGGAGSRLRGEDGGIVLLLGATAPARSGPAQAALFDRNFPVSSWGDARRLDPAGAGPYPCSRADVAATVDWVVEESDCFGVLDLRASAPQGRSGPAAGSLAAFCRREARIPRAAAPLQRGSGPLRDEAMRGPARALGALLDGRPQVVIEGQTPRRVGVGSWVIDLEVSVRGSGAADPASFRLGLDAGDAGDAWVGAAEAAGAEGPFKVLRPEGRTRTLQPLRPGDRRVLRIFVQQNDPGPRTRAPSIHLTLSAPRCRSTAKTVDLVK